jgi:hypothetical protein
VKGTIGRVNETTAPVVRLKTLTGRKGLTITEGIRRAITVWKFVEDEVAAGNKLAVIEADGAIRLVMLL